MAIIGLTAAFLTLADAPISSTESTFSPPILVELFTSQGCSSCPAADRLLSELAASDENIVTLSFHVDYWNYIGWTDPFSSADWSGRQRDYAAALDARQIYTPQLVVNGRRHGVGSDRREVVRMLSEAAADEAAARIELEIIDSGGDRISVLARTELGPHLTGQKLTAWVVVAEDGLVTPVGRGENARRELRNDRVVRKLELLGDISSLSSPAHRLDIDLDPEWRRPNLSVVAFVQDPDSLHIEAAALAHLAR